MPNSAISRLEITISVLIGFLPLLIITGPFLSDLSISLTSIITIIIIFRKKEWFYFYNIFFLSFIFWCVYLILLSLFSDYILNSLESSLFYIRYGIFSISIWYLLNSNSKELFIKILKIVFIVSFALLIFDSFFQFFNKQNLLGFPYKDQRLSSFFGEEKILGSFFARMLPMLFAIVSFKIFNIKFEYFFCILVLLCADIIIFLSGERTAFFYVILFSFAVISLTSKYKFIRIITLIISCVIVILIAKSYSDVKDRMIDRTKQQIDKIDKIYNFTIQHQVVYQTALKIYQDNYLFGIGPKNFRIVCKNEKYKTFTKLDESIDGCQSHPHNTYIQLLTEAGIIGFAPIFLVFLWINYIFFKHLILKIFYKKYLLNDLNIFLLLSVYISLWPLAPTGNFFNNWLSIIYFFPIGFLLYNFYYRNIKD